jgi:hypothetical protein
MSLSSQLGELATVAKELWQENARSIPTAFGFYFIGCFTQSDAN